jgi:hypothetical protein
MVSTIFYTVNFSDFKTSVNHLHLSYLMRVNSFPFGPIIHFYVFSFSLSTGVPDPLFRTPRGLFSLAGVVLSARPATIFGVQGQVFSENQTKT